MKNTVRLLIKKEPFIKKFFSLRKKVSLQKTAYIFLTLALICIDINTEAWGRPILTDAAYAAEGREVILFPSEKLSMVVLSEGTAPVITDIQAQDSETVVTYYENEAPTLLAEVVAANDTDNPLTSSEEYVTDLVVDFSVAIKQEIYEAGKRNDLSNKNELKSVNESADAKLEQAFAEKKAAEEEKKRLEAVCVNNPNMVITLTEGELDLFERLVQCEAGGEDMIGKILVANVVINRVNSSSFPNTVEGVINAKRQFQPVSSGIINNTTASSDTKEAVRRALSGEDYSKNALYFLSRKYASKSNASWFDNNLTKTVEHGSHEFFTSK